MSVNSMKQTSNTSNGARVSSIPKIMQSLRSAFREGEFRDAERELMAREESLRRSIDESVGILRDKCDVFEAELGEMKTQKYMWEEERRRLRRESEVNDDKLKDLARELSIARDKEEKSVKRYDALLEQLRVLEVEQKGLVVELANLRDEKEGLKRNLRDKEAEFDEIVRVNEVNSIEMEMIRRRNELLKEEKAKLGTLLEEVKMGMDKRIRELSEDNLRLKEVAAHTEETKNRLLKLEGDFISTMCCELKSDARFSSAQHGRILSVIVKALDSEGIGLTCNAQEADQAFVSNVNEPKVFLKSEKKSEEALKRTLVFEAEMVKENGASRENGTTVNNIIIVDSDDDDDENPVRVIGVKRKYGHPENLSEQCDIFKDDSLNQKHMKKLEHGSYEPVKPVLSTPSTADDGHKVINPQRQRLAPIRKCIEKLVRNTVEQRFDGFLDNGGKDDENSNSNLENNKAHKGCRPKFKEYMATHWKRKENKKLELAADMFCAFDEDDDFCAKAVCTLYRQHKSQLSSMKGSVCASSKRLEECDVDRVISLAKFLIGGDLKGKMKKSVDELKQHDQRGLDDCCRLAKKYSKQLFDIYKKGEDPLFSPLSADLQYN